MEMCTEIARAGPRQRSVQVSAVFCQLHWQLHWHFSLVLLGEMATQCSSAVISSPPEHMKMTLPLGGGDFYYEQGRHIDCTTALNRLKLLEKKEKVQCSFSAVRDKLH
jgi:hypothetical protein